MSSFPPGISEMRKWTTLQAKHVKSHVKSTAHGTLQHTNQYLGPPHPPHPQTLTEQANVQGPSIQHTTAHGGTVGVLFPGMGNENRA